MGTAVGLIIRRLRMMAPFGLKLWENAFQAIPDMSFFNVKNLSETSNGRLPPKDGSDQAQTWGKRVSGDPRHFIFRRPIHFLQQKKLSEKFFVNTPNFFSAKCLFWRSCAGLDVSGECSSKIHCQTYRFQPSTTLGGGVKREKTVFLFFFSFGVLAKKKLYLLRPYDDMIL